MVIGVIIEASPFHNGHDYFFKQIKERYPNSNIICVTSSSFTMRGEISLIDKFEKTSCLLKAGASFVFELPVSSTLQSGEYFAYEAVRILNFLNVDKIICGATFNSLDDVKQLDEIVSSKPYQELLKHEMTINHQSLKKASVSVLNELNVDDKLIEMFSESNNTLAWEYYQSIKKNKFKIELEFIKRIYDDYLPSGRMINKLLLENKTNEIKQYLPFDEKIIDSTNAVKRLIVLIKQNLLDENNLLNSNIDKEGIDHYILNHVDYQLNDNEFFISLSNKKYTTSFIKRYLIKRLLTINPLYQEGNPYLRLLGFNKKDINYLNSLSKNVKELIISSNNDKIDNVILKKEILATKLYANITNNFDLIKNENKLPIILGDEND